MFSTEARRSTNCAKKALILGHTSSGMGERTLAIKFKRAIEKAGYGVEPILDIIEWMGEEYEPLATLNYDLADGSFSLIEDLKTSLQLPSTDLLLILSWNFSLAAFFATGLHKTRPTVATLHAHHPTECILSKLYEPADLLITGSLLANERALKYGIDPAKILYLPHPYPAECALIHPSREYALRLAKQQGKTVGPNTRVVGCVGRFEYGKNCEFAVEAVRRLAAEEEDIVLVLKGDFPQHTSCPDYKPLFLEMLRTYSHEPWLLWDSVSTSYPQVLEEYASFDLLLHPSGAEVASQVAIECLGLQKPVILLDCSTNPYLFKDLATFVKTTGKIRPGPLPFYIPDLDDLCSALKRELKPPSREKVEERFHEKILEERIPLLFERNPQTIQALYQQDLKRYAL